VCLCLAGSLFSLAQAHAQSLDPSRLISQYGHTVWRTQDGIVPETSAIWSRETAGAEVEPLVPASIAYPREEVAAA